MNTLLLASQSRQRQELLATADIPFMVIPQNANERDCDWGLPLAQLLEHIAYKKMQCVELPEGKEGDIIFVLTADTMCQNMRGAILGKPESKQEAVAAIKSIREGGRVGTCFYISRKIYQDQKWIVQEEVAKYVETTYDFDMPDELIEVYFELEPEYMSISGAVSVDGYASQFLKSMQGSYSNMLGLPLFEVRETLELMNFFNNTHMK